MKIYVAAPWVRKQEASEVGKLLRSKGYVVVSRWHDNHYGENEAILREDQLRKEATEDFGDVMGADALVFLNLVKSEGKATELGISLARGIPVHVVGGKQNNVFHYLPQVNHHVSMETVLRSLDHASRSN